MSTADVRQQAIDALNDLPQFEVGLVRIGPAVDALIAVCLIRETDNTGDDAALRADVARRYPKPSHNAEAAAFIAGARFAMLGAISVEADPKYRETRANEAAHDACDGRDFPTLAEEHAFIEGFVESRLARSSGVADTVKEEDGQ